MKKKIFLPRVALLKCPNFFPGQKRKVKERLKHYVKDAYACDLIDKLLWLDPSKRIDSDGALDHEFLWTDPLPCSLVS